MSQVTPQSPGYFRPEVGRQFFPGCWNCHAPHPLARKVYAQADICPDCGVAVDPPGRREISYGAVPGVAGILLRVGERLSKFAKGLNS